MTKWLNLYLKLSDKNDRIDKTDDTNLNCSAFGNFVNYDKGIRNRNDIKSRFLERASIMQFDGAMSYEEANLQAKQEILGYFVKEKYPEIIAELEEIIHSKCDLC